MKLLSIFIFTVFTIFFVNNSIAQSNFPDISDAPFFLGLPFQSYTGAPVNLNPISIFDDIADFGENQTTYNFRIGALFGLIRVDPAFFSSISGTQGFPFDSSITVYQKEHDFGVNVTGLSGLTQFLNPVLQHLQYNNQDSSSILFGFDLIQLTIIESNQVQSFRRDTEWYINVSENIVSPDVIALNFILQVKYLEAAFFNAAVTKFQDTDFNQTSNSPTDPDHRPYDIVVIIHTHETSHIDYIKSLINDLNGVISNPCASYDFSSIIPSGSVTKNDIIKFYEFGVFISDISESSMIQILQFLSNSTLARKVEQMAVVEARHSTYFATRASLLGSYISPYPFNLDQPLNRKAIFDSLKNYAQNCFSSL